MLAILGKFTTCFLAARIAADVGFTQAERAEHVGCHARQVGALPFFCSEQVDGAAADRLMR